MLLLKNGKLSAKGRSFLFSLNYYIKDALEHKEKVIRMHEVRNAGSGRSSHYSFTEHENYKTMLKELCILFKEGNDAPRGGRLGDYIEITTKAAQAIQGYLSTI